MKWLTITCLVMCFTAAGRVEAASIALEAEDFFSTTDGGAGSGFAIVNDAGAFGGLGITTNGDSTGSSPTHRATYNLNFNTTGTYYLYARYVTDSEGQGGASGNLSDSFFVPTTFDSSPSFLNINNLASDSAPNVYAWSNISTWAASQSSSGTTYNIAAPGSQFFVIGGREDGLTLDAFVFSTTNGLSDAELDAILTAATLNPVPEPSTAVLAAFLLVAVWGARRWGASPRTPAVV